MGLDIPGFGGLEIPGLLDPETSGIWRDEKSLCWDFSGTAQKSLVLDPSHGPGIDGFFFRKSFQTSLDSGLKDA
jgi:hypothetical protein